MFLCFIHIIDIKDTYEKHTVGDFTNYLDVASQFLGNEIDQTQMVVQSANETLENKDTVFSYITIFNLLKSYAKLENFYGFQFVDSNRQAYSASGSIFTMLDSETFNLLYTGDTPSIIMDDSLVDDDGRPILAFCSPCFRNEIKIGVFFAYKKLDGMLDENTYSYLNQLGNTFLVDKDGTIITKSGNVTGGMKEQKNIYDVILNYADSDTNAITEANDFISSLGTEQNFSIDISTNNNSHVIAAFSELEGSQDLYLVCFFNEKILDSEMQPIMLRSILVCLAIILLMILIIILIWLSFNRSNHTIEKIAYYDPVTGGKNYNYFNDRAIEIMNNNSIYPYMILRMDIANFRYLNEAYGHKRADEVLKICNEIAGNYFSDKELFARMFSDQYVALCINDGDAEERRIRMIEDINERARAIGIKYPVRLKCGIYLIRKNDTDLEIMIDRANAARKSLEGDEKVLIAYYSNSIIQSMRKIDKVESEMVAALENGEFKVFLQPKWDIVKDKLAGAEALVRWMKPDGNIVYPDDFIPIFEKNGFIEKLDFYMLEAVCRFIRKLIDDGLEPTPVSINQSKILLHNPEYVQNICRIVQKYNLPNGLIELEITETLFFNEKEKMIHIMNELKEKNIILSMDDFGSGYSSLNLLKDIPFDVLKIDRLFFTESITSKASTWILRKIVEMAEGLGIQVVCEGVETIEQVNALREIGCHYVQGYFYSRPIPVLDFVKKYL